MIKSYVSKVGVSLVALALVVAPSLVLAQTAPLAVSITSPSNGANVTVGQAVTFSAVATGGTSPIDFDWDFGVNETPLSGTTVSKSFSTAGTKTVKVYASDRNFSDSEEITINVIEAGSPLVISNIQVPTETITKNSAVVTWTTNRNATSRVIYDTVSHVGTDGATVGTAPNYSYANSEPASVNASSAKVTSHSVTLTGLSANTKYYFRVLSAE